MTCWTVGHHYVDGGDDHYVDGGDGCAATVESAALSGLQTADALVAALVAALGVGDSDRCDGGRCAVQ